MNTVFFGSSSYVIPIIDKLKSQLEISYVFTTDQSKVNAVPNYCEANKIPYSSVTTLSNSDTLYKLYAANAPVAILADFGVVIPPHLTDAFPKGILNIHPSLLPKYRGPTPVQTALLNGDKTTGVTIIRLDNDIDHGPILAQQEVAISPTDTAQSLYEHLFEVGTELLLANISEYGSGKLAPKEQDHTQASFTKQLTRQDGYIDCSKPLGQIVLKNMIRAYYPWPGVWTKLQMANGVWRIVKLLPDNKLQMEGKKPASVKDFLNGYAELRTTIEKLFV